MSLFVGDCFPIAGMSIKLAGLGHYLLLWISIFGTSSITDVVSVFLEAGCRGVLHHLMDLGHFQAMFHIPLQQRWNNHDLFSIHTSNQTPSFLVHDPLFFYICFHVVTNVVCGYLDVFKDWGHLSKLGLQIIRDVNIDFQSTKKLLVHDGL